MNMDHYQHESRQILDALIEADGALGSAALPSKELTYIDILQRTGISTLIAVSVIGDLLRSEKIVYRMEDGVQYFRIMEHFKRRQQR